MALDVPVEAPPQVWFSCRYHPSDKGNAKVAVSLVGYDQELKDGRCAETDDILPDGFKLKKEDGVLLHVLCHGQRMPYIWGDDAEDFRPERWLNNGVFQPKSPFKFIAFHVRLQFTFFFCLQKRLYVLIFISGKNKNENMEMERVIEFPHARGSLSQKETAFGLGHCSSGPQVPEIDGGLLGPIGPLGFGIYDDLLGPPIDGVYPGLLVAPINTPELDFGLLDAPNDPPAFEKIMKNWALSEASEDNRGRRKCWPARRACWSPSACQLKLLLSTPTFILWTPPLFFPFYCNFTLT
ncbi:uncharacterized protein LOC114289781 isoform X6 [Camellia sinensis]|uniref:uncharacterized protein LOC114289781 isoform X6 n=1 Tax=Camellia sinensis TaxID=4442 RepID=UPI0010366CE1|nr:uncharacterized protein LOC114289781 isoform X6 [Camellia sinensis]